MSLLRILAKKKMSSILTSSNQQTTATNSTPNIETRRAMLYVLSAWHVFFLTVLLQVPVNVNRMEKN